LPLILLADDDADARSILGQVLRGQGHIVHTVADGQQLVAACLAMAESGERPDVIVTDIEMPHLDGVNAVRELRRRGFDVPAVFVTGHREPEVAVQVRALGLQLLLKPLDVEALKRSVTELVGVGSRSA
jgi:CheY-like chemotaxis protein